MIDYKERIADQLIAAGVELTKEDLLDLIEVPQDESMGDYALPCFKLARVLRKAPPMIAADIAEKLNVAIEDDADSFIDRVVQVNAYVNVFLSRAGVAGDVVGEVLEKKDDFGKSDIGGNKTVIVEYSSPNIAKPFHIGHIRSTVIGNAIYKIYDALGYDTIRINHLGDYGTQFGKMICAYRHWGNEEDVKREPIKTLLSYYTKFHEEAEKDPSLNDEARAIFAKLENGGEEEVKLWQWFREESLKEFGRVYKMLGIEFDSYNGESFYSDKMERFVRELEEKGLLEESEGAQIVRLDDYDMPPALIKKSDGSTLYITRDIAAAVYRKETYNFYKNIYVVASQQNLHFQQWFRVLDLMGYDWAYDCVHVPFGLVSLADGNTMSTRTGHVVFLEDVLNQSVEKTEEIMRDKGVDEEVIPAIARQVGIGAVVFNELSNNRIKDYVFDWDRVLNFDGETGPYVQYTHARSCSVLRKADPGDVEKAYTGGIDAAKITGDSAYDLVKLIYRMPAVIEEAAGKYEPSIVTRHIIQIASTFNRFYHDEHILVEDENERIAKIALVAAAGQAIRNGLNLLGIEAPERM